MDNSVKEIYQLIKKYKVITLYGHINPDPDCYGSALAFREILRDNFKNKEVYALGYGNEKLYDRLARYDEVSDDKIKESGSGIKAFLINLPNSLRMGIF